MDQTSHNYIHAKAVAEQVCLLKKNQFLAQTGSSAVSVNAGTFSPPINSWCRIEGFRAGQTEADTLKAAEEASFRWLRGANGGCCAFVLENTGGEWRVLCGSAPGHTPDAAFRTALPECVITPTAWQGCAFAYNGILTGTVDSGRLANLLAAMQGENFYAACIVVPASDEDREDKLRENEKLTAYLERFRTVRRAYGSSSRRVEEIQNPRIVRAIELLQEESRYLTDRAGHGFARCCIRFGAADSRVYRQLASALSACAGGSSEGYEAVRVMRVNGVHRNAADCLAIPRVVLPDAQHGGYAADMISWQSMEALALFCAVPTQSCRGFYVSKDNIDFNALELFPAVRGAADGLPLGTELASGATVRIPLPAMRYHTFVTGKTGIGKSTTVKQLIQGLYERGVSFLILEPAKKEYIELLPQVPDLKVYTPGTDGPLLHFNPLEVEDGVLIEAHVDAVIRAINAASPGEHPIPEAFSGLLKHTYGKAGWHYGMMAYHDRSRPFPTFRDVYESIPEYIEKSALYGPEVRQNLYGALNLRSEMLYTGAMGAVFADPFGLTAKDLLEGHTLLELTDFPESGRDFLMNILLFRLHAYLSGQPRSDGLDRVIIVEEAHNIFRKTLLEDSGQARSNNYFEKLLAEIGASGTGMLLCDQRPSILSDAVLANTSLKLVHELGEAQDRNIMAESIGLSEAQKVRLGELGKGRCLVAVSGSHGVQHTAVSAPPPKQTLNPACHLCTARFRCRRNAVRTLMQGMDQTKLNLHLARIHEKPYDPTLLSQNIDLMLRDLNISASGETKCCVLGELLSTEKRISYPESRRIVCLYKKQRNGGNTNE